MKEFDKSMLSVHHDEVLEILGLDSDFIYVFDEYTRCANPVHQIVRGAYQIFSKRMQPADLPELLRRFVPAFEYTERRDHGSLNDMWLIAIFRLICQLDAMRLQMHLKLLAHLSNYATEFSEIPENLRMQLRFWLYSHPPYAHNALGASSAVRPYLTFEHYKFSAEQGLLITPLTPDEVRQFEAKGVTMHELLALQEKITNHANVL
jgi:hypothetical protein